jgi:hypothetical protein
MKTWSPYRALLLFAITFLFSSSLLAAGLPQPEGGYGTSFPSPHRLHVRSDFDGDQVLDTAIVRHHATHYTVSIHFSGKPSITFRAYDAGEPVLGIAAMDVDGDRDRDIVLIGLNPLIPAGLWVNEDAGSFHRERSWRALVAQEGAFHSVHNASSENPDPGSLLESGPDASVPEGLHFALVGNETELSASVRHLPLSGLSVSVLSRGPPSHS